MISSLISAARRVARKTAGGSERHLVVTVLVAFAAKRDWQLALAAGAV